MPAQRTERQGNKGKERTGGAAAARAAPSAGTASAVTPQARWQMIAEAAYFRAQKRGFAPGGEIEDWLEAETEVDRQLGRG